MTIQLIRAVTAALLATSALAAWAQAGGAGTLVVGIGTVPRHLNSAVQSGIATGIPAAQVFASPTDRTNYGRALLAENPDNPGSLGLHSHDPAGGQ